MIPLQDLKERKLFQWAAAYLAGAWLVLQVLGLLAQPFAWPDLVLRVSTVLLGVGFFGVLVLAWYHGEQGRQRASGIELLMLAGILLIAGIAVATVSRSAALDSPETPVLASAFTASVGEQGSIAVLPFVNMSSDPEQEYFADGLSEELLNVLAQIPELRVAARTSSFSFKGTNAAIDSIGRALNVAHVLEGAVRKGGDRVRITAQLVDAQSGFHLWSETFDRDVSDIFAVQDEISRAIVNQLQLKLSGGRDQGILAKQETSDAGAHTLLLRGIAAERKGTRETDVEAERLFRAAIERDPDYVQAHAQLANILSGQAYRRYITMDRGYAAARASAESALALDPNQSMAHAVLGAIGNFHDWDFAAAEDHFQRALASNPGDSRARSMRAWLLMRLGRREEALQEARRAVELDPLSMSAYNNLGAMYSYAGQPQQAVDALQAGLALAPEATTVAGNLALVYSYLGRHAEAIQTATHANSLEPEHQFPLAALGYAYARAGHRVRAQETLSALQATPDASPYLIATVYAGLNEKERMFEMLEKALQQRDESLPDLGVDPVFEEYRTDLRFARLLQRIGLD